MWRREAMQAGPGAARRTARRALVALALGALPLIAACAGDDVGNDTASDTASDATTRPATRSMGGKRFRVGIVFDNGGRGDRGFNDGAAAGAALAARSDEVEVIYADASDAGGRDTTLRRFAEQKLDLVMSIGFLSSGSATAIAAKHPRVRFAVMDYAIPTDAQGRAVLPPANLTAVTFREEEGAYLVGAVAGLTTRTRTVGFVGGMTSPMIGRFEAGFEAGVRRVCPTCQVIASYAGDTPAAFRDPAAGRRLALAAYAADADIVFQAAGETGVGVFQAAEERRRRVIGVDVDQSSLAPGLVVTSMLKRMDVAVADVIRSAQAGTLNGGFRSYGLAEDGVGFVDGAGLTGATRERVGVLRDALVADLLTVPTTR